MSDQTKRLTVDEKHALRPLVEMAQRYAEKARETWTAVGQQLDAFGSNNHSQCCPIGGMHKGARNGSSGTTPCPCGWDGPEGVEEVLRRMVAYVGRTSNYEAAQLVTDALAALDRAER